ncbi:MAG: hypothetical protein AB7T38_11240 [Nitrospirales bacterium]
MAYGDIPSHVISKLSAERFRMFHALWHFVRNEAQWTALRDGEPQQHGELVRQGWTPPRFEGAPGAGMDFLFMHSMMIDMVNQWGQEGASPPNTHNSTESHHPLKATVVPWLDIPWDHQDPVWPMPEVDVASNSEWPPIFGRSKDQATTDFYQQRVMQEFANRAWLRRQSLDAFGTLLERTIHGWFHMHWSTEPPNQPNSLDPQNDWLGSPFSSHVNRHFWKLHGWIDNRIRAWADARGEEADISSGWGGPQDFVTGEPHSADPQLFNLLKFQDRPILLMPWKDLLLEQEVPA